VASGRIQLELLSGDDVRESMGFDDDRIEIGKLVSAQVRLDDENISRKHAAIKVDSDGRVTVTDLGSTNGTRLNGMRINKAHLADGDLIEVGITRIRVRLSSELQKKAETGAPSSRTEMNRDGFYRTIDGSSVRGRLALEGALLWEDSPIQVETFIRTRFPPAISGVFLLFFALVPFVLWVLAITVWLLSLPITWSIGFSAAGLGLALYFIMDMEGWRTMLSRGLWLVRHGESIHIGETEECRFFLPQEFLGKRTYPLVVPYHGGWALNLRRKEVRGDILHKGQTLTVEDARTAQIAKGNLIPIEHGTKCRLRFGQFSMLLSHVIVPRRPPIGVWTMASLGMAFSMVGSLLVHFFIMFLFVFYQPHDDIQIRRKENNMLSRFFHIESVLQQEREKENEEEFERPEEEESKFKDEELSMDSENVKDADMAPDEEQEDVSVTRRRKRPKTDDDRKLDMEERKIRAKNTSERLIPTQQLARLEGLMGSMAGPAIRVTAIGSAGAVGGDTVADSINTGSMLAGTAGGIFNVGEMGDTLSAGSSGVGGIVSGLDKNSLRTGKGKGKRFGNIKFKDSPKRAVVTTGRVSVSGGALDRAIIKKHINRQKGSIIYCYKKAVQSQQDLEGKVIVRFTISPTGKVMRPGIKKSTLGSSSVESCIVSRLRRWRFPAPKNGGAVAVSYPFLFKTR
jgi:TonB family protein